MSELGSGITLDGRTAVVTGAARGIGRALTDAFVTEGMSVLACDVDAAALGELERDGVRTVIADVASADDVRRLADVAFGIGPVHLLCNNAGVVAAGRAWELPLETWTRVLAVDLWGPIHGVHEFVPRMLATGEPGHVVNIASMASLLARPGIAPYSVAKHGLLALSETLELELREIGAPIGVTTVFPGRVDTDLGSERGRPSGSGDPGLDRGVRSAAAVATQVVQAVRAGQRFLFTHPERINEVVARMEGMYGPR